MTTSSLRIRGRYVKSDAFFTAVIPQGGLFGMALSHILRCSVLCVGVFPMETITHPTLTGGGRCHTKEKTAITHIDMSKKESKMYGVYTYKNKCD
jgi:hypothetical protein